jgi:hypothetical protein
VERGGTNGGQMVDNSSETGSNNLHEYEYTYVIYISYNIIYRHTHIYVCVSVGVWPARDATSENSDVSHVLRELIQWAGESCWRYQGNGSANRFLKKW